jgi:hypothetical protein
LYRYLAACSTSSILVALLADLRCIGRARSSPERTAQSIPCRTCVAACLSPADRGLCVLLATWVRCRSPHCFPRSPSAVRACSSLRSHHLSAHSTASRSSSCAELGCFLRLFI